MPEENRIYSKLALVYSHLMRRIRYDLWAEYINNISKKLVTPNSKILELGAGSGLLTTHLQKYFPEIIPSDISLSMLKQFEGNSRKIVCDMTVLPFKESFNVVISAFDSVNYLLSEIKLKSLFKEVERVLKPSGIFLFDVSLEKNSFKHAANPVSHGKLNGISYINKSEYNPVSRMHTNIFEIKDNKQVYCETHKQKIYPFETYFKIIEKTGLYPVECYDAFSFSEGNPGCERVQFILKKKS